MKTQPNLNKIKIVLANVVFYSPKTDISILMESVAQKKLLPTFFRRKEEFLKLFENFLDNVDIRCVDRLIDITLECGGKLPKWISNKDFSIDYNKHGMLDLQKN